MPDGQDIIARLNTGIMRAKLATIPGHEADMRPALDELGSAIKVITQVLGRQAAQLAALRAGASTEDLHAAPDGQDERIAALEAEADALHDVAEGWRKRAEAAEALVVECEPYLREGETPRERIDRERADTDAVGKLYHREKVKAENARRQALEEVANILEKDAADCAARGTRALQSVAGTLAFQAGVIRNLADKPAAGGEA